MVAEEMQNGKTRCEMGEKRSEMKKWKVGADMGTLSRQETLNEEIRRSAMVKIDRKVSGGKQGN
jgi:hypothetical protein